MGQDLVEGLVPGAGPLQATVLLTHLHFDHILGLPFFGPLLMAGAELDVYGPRPGVESLRDAVSSIFRPPFFPLELRKIEGRVTFHEVGDEDFVVGDVQVRSRRVPHPGNTLGFRLESGGVSMAYLPDHQAPPDLHAVCDGALDLCDGADLVVHDAQYTVEEFTQKWNWGHSTAGYAVAVAAQARAERLLLFHHDPSRDDRGVAELERRTREVDDAGSLVDVAAAREGVSIEVGGVPAVVPTTEIASTPAAREKSTPAAREKSTPEAQEERSRARI
jgi:phosphoribosyl 1,2-cyclic phosphodiesterase